MSVLFVCRANVGRSQMAQEFYNQLAPGMATSAGTAVDLPGQRLIDRAKAKTMLAAMAELGFDLSENRRTALTSELAAAAERIIVMAEPVTIPSYLKDNPATELWDIADPADMTLEQTRIIRDLIQEQVQALFKRS